MPATLCTPPHIWARPEICFPHEGASSFQTPFYWWLRNKEHLCSMINDIFPFHLFTCLGKKASPTVCTNFRNFAIGNFFLCAKSILWILLLKNAKKQFSHFGQKTPIFPPKKSSIDDVLLELGGLPSVLSLSVHLDFSGDPCIIFLESF